MVKLNKDSYPAALEIYRSTESFFPLIASVLLDEQDGEVYADDNATPRQVYVEHTFGFAQIFGISCAGFEADLEQYLLIDRSFSAPKVRLYTPHLPEFLNDPRWDSLRSLRQRFFIEPGNSFDSQFAALQQLDTIDLQSGDELDIEEIERVFGVVGRFWRSPTDFLHKSNAIVAFRHGKPGSICYSAAHADGSAEIDVLTLPEFRMTGVGKLTVMHFVKRCFDQSISPLWDCFSNNEGSMNLCRSVGFHAPRPPYPFFTINR